MIGVNTDFFRRNYVDSLQIGTENNLNFTLMGCCENVNEQKKVVVSTEAGWCNM